MEIVSRGFRALWFVVFVWIGLATSLTGSIAHAREGEPPADELWTREEINQHATRFLIRHDFTALEALAIKFRTERARTASGLWASTIFFTTFGQLRNLGRWSGNLNAATKHFEAWMEAYPSSPTSFIAYAWFMYQIGWVASLNHERPDAAIVSRHAFDEAWRALNESRDFDVVEPEWYVVATRLLTAQHRTPPEDKAIFSEGLSKVPFYYELYFAGLEYL